MIILARLLNALVWRGQRLGVENLPERGPALFIGNHCGALGPIAAFSAAGMVGFRLYPWIHADMLDPVRCPPYLQTDFCENELGLRPPLSSALARLLAHAVVPLLTGIGSIPVSSNGTLSAVRDMLNVSLEHLLGGQNLLVFPEKPEWQADLTTQIHRFSRGVLWLVELYYFHSGRSLCIIPFSVRAHPRRICFLPPLDLTPALLERCGGKEAWIHAIELEIRDTYSKLDKVT